jgi:hypothetical protein
MDVGCLFAHAIMERQVRLHTTTSLLAQQQPKDTHRYGPPCQSSLLDTLSGLGPIANKTAINRIFNPLLPSNKVLKIRKIRPMGSIIHICTCE